MANILQIKRSLTTLSVPASGVLAEGELVSNIPDKKLWIGDDSGNPISLNEIEYLNDIGDVETYSPDDGDRLIWDVDEEKWISKRSLSALGIMEFEYTMQLPSDSTPAIKELSRNNNDPTLTTIIYLNKQDQGRADISLFIEKMRSGDWLNLHRKTTIDRYEKYDIIGTPTLVGNIWEIPVEYYDHDGTPLSDGNRIRLMWNIQGKDTDNYREPMGSGLHHGGQITQGTGSLDVDISKGRGIIINAITDPFKIQREDISWNDQTITITPEHTDTQELHMIFVDSTGAILSQPVQNIQYKLIYDYIRLGWAEISINSIISVIFAPFIIGQTTSNLSDMFYAINESAKTEGMRLQPCDDNLNIYCEKGKIFMPGIGWQTDPKNQNILDIPQAGDETTPIILQIFNKNAKPVMSPQYEIPKYYDNNGNHTPLTGGEAVIHYVFYSASGYSIQMGQTAYIDFANAFRNLNNDKDNFIFAPGSNISGRSILLGQIIISKLAINFKNKALADIISTINDETGNTISPIDLTLVPQYLLHTMASQNLTMGDELSMDVNGDMQKYPATGGEGNSQYTSDTIVLHSAEFLNSSNNQGIIAWVNNTSLNTIYFVTAQGNSNGTISYSPVSSHTVSGNINALRLCKIDTGRAGYMWSDTGGSNMGVIQNNGTGSAPTTGTTQTLGGVSVNLGVDCTYDPDEGNMIGVFSTSGTVYNRYCPVSGNNLNSPPKNAISMISGSQVRCVNEGGNVIVTSINGTTSIWREAAWNKPFFGDGAYDDQGSSKTLSNCSNHCGLQVQTGNIMSQFEYNGSIQTYTTTYSSGSSMETPTTYGNAMSGKWGDLIKTDSGIGYSTILNNSYKVEIYEGSISGTYELTYTSIFAVNSSNTEIQSLMFGTVFAFGIGYATDNANKVYLIDSSVTRTDHFIGVAPSNIIQGQRFNVDIALPMITLPREYPPGTFYNYGPYKYQVITHNQAVMIIEATTMQSAVI